MAYSILYILPHGAVDWSAVCDCGISWSSHRRGGNQNDERGSKIARNSAFDCHLSPGNRKLCSA